jgi:hypothetical protein
LTELEIVERESPCCGHDDHLHHGCFLIAESSLLFGSDRDQELKGTVAKGKLVPLALSLSFLSVLNHNPNLTIYCVDHHCTCHITGQKSTGYRTNSGFLEYHHICPSHNNARQCLLLLRWKFLLSSFRAIFISFRGRDDKVKRRKDASW